MQEIRFREIFARAPISIWEEDFSAVGEWLESLRSTGISDLRAYLKSNPQEIRRSLALVKLLEVNEVTLTMWEVESKEELLEKWQDLFTDETFEVFAEELLAIWEGRNQLTFQCTAKTATGRPIHYELHWVAPLIENEMNLSQVIVAIVDVTERIHTEKALEEMAEHAGLLSNRLINVQEKNRRHLARELHDEFGQILTAVGLKLGLLQNKVPENAKVEINDCINLVNEAGTRIKNLALELRPSMLDDFGLESTLYWLVDQHSQRTEIKFEVTGHLEDVPEEIATACYRVVQEALANIIRHAQATQVNIDLKHDSGYLEILIKDNGVGFDVNQHHDESFKHTTLGLLGMKERIKQAGGTLTIDSEQGKGTSIQIHIP